MRLRYSCSKVSKRKAGSKGTAGGGGGGVADTDSTEPSSVGS